jgi:glyoxylase-like metal-dependent hydrolase (beta-lactamase superfamily II)
VVYLPKYNLMFGGCMIRALTDAKPGFIGYANMKEWPASVRKVIDKYPDVRMVVPGHGKAGDQCLLTHTVKILDRWNDENP